MERVWIIQMYSSIGNHCNKQSVEHLDEWGYFKICVTPRTPLVYLHFMCVLCLLKQTIIYSLKYAPGAPEDNNCISSIKSVC